MADKIESLEPIFDAWDKMKVLLLSPVRVSAWLVIGFTAWLTHLGEGYGGGGLNIASNVSNLLNFNVQKPPTPVPAKPSIMSSDLLQAATGSPEFQQTLDFLRNLVDKLGVNLGLIAALAVFAFSLFIVFGLLVVWLKSRGEFMFIHNLALDQTEIARPWSDYAEEGNSVFLWRICLAVVSYVIGLLLLAVLGLTCLNWISACFQAKTLQAPNALAITGIIIFFVSLTFCSLFFTTVSVLFNNFVIPTMFKKRLLAVEGCLDVLKLVKATPLAFVKYLLVLLVLHMVVNSVVYFAAYFLTCCIGMLILSIPYVWAVVLLPVLSLFRLYSLGFLAQFGDEYDVFPKPETTPPTRDVRPQVSG